MLDLGFIHDLRKIVEDACPPSARRCCFRQPCRRQIAELAAAILTDPVKVEVTPPGKAADKVEQSVHFVTGQNDKTVLLEDVRWPTIPMAGRSSSLAPSTAPKS